MSAMAMPIAAKNVDAWKAWAGELTGARKTEFEDMNKRFGLTEHRAYLQPTPDGNFLAVIVQEGPGSETFAAKLVASDHPFDRWFVQTIAGVHGIDPNTQAPPVPARYV